MPNIYGVIFSLLLDSGLRSIKIKLAFTQIHIKTDWVKVVHGGCQVFGMHKFSMLNTK